MRCSTRVGLTQAAIVAVLLMFYCPGASAQSFEKLAIGPQVSFHFPASEDLGSTVSLGFSYKLGRPKDHSGWGPDFGFGWFGADLVGDLDGHINVRPLLGGVGYTMVRGKFRTHFAALTGPAFNKIKVNDAERTAYSTLLGVPVIGVDIKNSWAVKPGVRVSYSVNRRFGVFVSSDYEYVRPTLEIHTATGTTERKLKADLFNIKTGILVAIK